MSPDPPLRVLLVCSNGGHLGQLHQLRDWWAQHERLWVTFDKADAQHLLADEQVQWGYYPTTRNIPNLLRNLWLAVRVLRRWRPQVVVSTGAGIAFPFFVLGKLFGVRTVYLEVFDRIDSATLTGRLCRPFTDLLCVQWEEQRALYRNSVVIGPVFASMAGAAPGAGESGGFGLPAAEGVDGTDSADAHTEAPDVGGADDSRPLVLVTAGTDVHRFDRLIDWVDRWLETPTAHSVECIVQHGTSRPPKPPAVAVELLPLTELHELMRRATIVVAQGGPGGIVDSRDNGRIPIVVPRRHALDEHVDDHQLAFTARLAKDGLIQRVDTEQEFQAAVEAGLAHPERTRIPIVKADQDNPAVTRFAAEVAALMQRGDSKE